MCQSAVQRVAAENDGVVVGRPRIRHSTVPNGGGRGGTRHLVVRRRTCSAHPSVAFAARPVAFLSRPTRRVEGTRGGGGGDGGCRVVRAGWSSYPTDVLRTSTYPSGTCRAGGRSPIVRRRTLFLFSCRLQISIYNPVRRCDILHEYILRSRVFFFLNLFCDRLIT